LEGLLGVSGTYSEASNELLAEARDAGVKFIVPGKQVAVARLDVHICIDNSAGNVRGSRAFAACAALHVDVEAAAAAAAGAINVDMYPVALALLGVCLALSRTLLLLMLLLRCCFARCVWPLCSLAAACHHGALRLWQNHTLQSPSRPAAD
jgi:hypothetical protein